MPPDDEGLPRPPRPSFETPEALLELQPGEQPAPVAPGRPGRVHLVVVLTRAEGEVIVARFWHPSLHRWRETSFVDESGWVLRQQQALDGPQAYELIFEARREDFSRPSAEAMLQDVGLTPEDVADLIDRVERENGPDQPR
jgi:hypothetical protein